jgi:hypothetical protein
MNRRLLVRLIVIVALIGLFLWLRRSQTPPRHGRKSTRYQTGAGCGVHCGTWRWQQKTLSDSEAGEVSTQAETTTVSALRELPEPQRSECSARDSARLPSERRRVQVDALLEGFKEEMPPKGDQDFHLVISDPSDRSATMVAEIPSPECDGACASGHAPEFAKAREAVIDAVGEPRGRLKVLNSPYRVRIEGVVFFDCEHMFQGVPTGFAPNVAEIHPVLKIQMLGPTDLPRGELRQSKRPPRGASEDDPENQ